MDTTRRSLLFAGSLALLPGVAAARTLTGSRAGRSIAGTAGRSGEPSIRLATLTDIHYADADTRGNRHYRDSIAKCERAVREINDASRSGGDAGPVSLCVQLGDLIDSRDTPIEEGGVEQEIAYLRQIDRMLQGLVCERHDVVGNHCVHTLTKDEFAEHSAAQRSFYSFDRPFSRGQGSLHVVVLDACFTGEGEPYGRRNFHWTDANIPPHELAWLEADLAATQHPTIVCTHQRLDGEGSTTIRNAEEVREILVRSERVVAVLQGHHHENSVALLDGIPYLVMRAVVEGSGADNHAFGLVDVYPDLSVLVHGFGTQADHEIRPKAGADP